MINAELAEHAETLDAASSVCDILQTNGTTPPISAISAVSALNGVSVRVLIQPGHSTRPSRQVLRDAG